MSTPKENYTEPRIIQCFLDTRPLWEIPPALATSNPRDEVQKLKFVASKELSLLTWSEQESVLKFYHLRDAKMSLASHLLKHFVVARYGSVKWSQSKITRDSRKKPCYVRATDEATRVDFNVSHQAGIVSLIAAVGFHQQVDVGTDVVCWNERLKVDYAHVDRSGLFDWLDMHADVFAESEVQHMKYGALELRIEDFVVRSCGKDAIARCEKRGGSIDATINGNEDQRTIKVPRDLIVDAKLRRFSAMWCARESYVKMTGEALLAPWLKDLEILDVQAPKARAGSGDSPMAAGEMLKDFRILFKGKQVRDVEMEISAIGIDFMIGGAVRTPLELADAASLKMGQWQRLELEEVLGSAEEHR